MDLKAFYRKLREIEAGISEPHPVIVSKETADGGRAGVLTEVPKEIAARMVLEDKARLASEEEAARFRQEIEEAKRLAEQQAAASRLQVTVISEGDLKKPSSVSKSSRP